MKNISTDLTLAKNTLDQHELVAIPTETVYGLAANALNASAVNKIYSLKHRPQNNPLIIHCHSVEQIKQYVLNFPKKAEELGAFFWPGPLTLLLKKNHLIPDFVTAGSEFAAFRIPNHPLTLELLKQLDYPLVAPSANPSNRISPTKAKHVFDYFQEQIPCILDGGDCKEGIESTIVQLTEKDSIILRSGTITYQQLFYVVPTIQYPQENEETPTVPGMSSKHYSPITPFKVVDKIDKEEINCLTNQKIAVITQKKEALYSSLVDQFCFSENGNLNEVARNLYDLLIRLDAMNYALIVAELSPETGVGIAINNRLKRAQNCNL